MTVITRHEIVARRRVNIAAGIVLAVIAAGLYALCRVTGNGGLERLTATL